MHILLSDLAATQRFGACLGASIDQQALIALEGSLGAGKTTLVKAVGAELGVAEVIVSPTFTMLNEYHSGRLPLFHLDIYRGGETGETIDLEMLAMELDEILAAGGLAMIEWPQYFTCDGRSYFEGRDYLHIHMQNADRVIKEKRPNIFKEQEEKIEPAQGHTEGTKQEAIPTISQAVDNREAGERFEGVLRAKSPPEKYIKDGFTEARIATLSANGVSSVALLAKLSSGLSAMVINL
jgi:tRNA threonylcarbamoyladenosine biosynthesis protein TsaE